MKDMIKYYYNLNDVQISLYYDSNNDDINRKELYYVKTKTSNYVLKNMNSDISMLNFDNISNLKNVSFFLVPIVNINNEIVTKINNKEYILFKTNGMCNTRISIFDIKTDYFIKNCDFNIHNWINMWENKIDNFENWLVDKKTQYSNLMPLFEYFIGLSENALLYLKNIELDIQKNNINLLTNQFSNLVVSHRRLSIKTTLYDYYDPTLTIVDHPSRDIAEYVKSEIINKCFDINIFSNYIKKISFTPIDFGILFARIMFPTFFYDYIEEADNQILSRLPDIVDYYEKCIYDIHTLLYKNWNIKKVEWLFTNKKSQG